MPMYKVDAIAGNSVGRAMDCMRIKTVRIDSPSWSRRLAEWVRLFVSLSFLAILTPLRAQTLTSEEIYETVLPSMMTLEVETRGGEKCIGTAFLAVREGLAVTAWHLVQDARKVTAKFASHEVAEVPGVIDWDEARDVALVRVNVSGRPLSKICPVDPKIGTRAYVIGAPKGYEFSISDGLVSQMQMIDGFSQCQISCPISSGNSGGPVMNTRGEILGVVTWSQKDAQNLNFATPSTCLQTLKAQSSLTLWAGLSRERRARQHHQVAHVLPARIPPNASEDQLGELRTLLELAAGEKVTVTVSRGTAQQTFHVTLPKELLK